MASTHIVTVLDNFQYGTLNYPTGFRALTTRTLWLILYLFYPFFSILTFMKTSVINNHIKNVAGRFAGKLYGKSSISLSRYSLDLLGYLYSCEVFRRTRYSSLLITDFDSN